MSSTVISVENLGKEYIIGGREKGYETFREMLLSAAAAPFRRLQRLSGRGAPEDRVWALKDVSFEVKEGEVVGIIGRNGAGKSTLLKILSRITAPTTGRAEISGRVSSLLEVGTGFHPELTGRENIYLNGAILGMSRAEINSKLDEIVDFSGVEKFLDTPVKRYSSGMLVRLAFAVAAHLEPEILVIDEVLAVGDSQFQKKCLGKMKEVGRSGRTILFVSHNMAMISSLCEKAIQLDNGELRAMGPTDNVILGYATFGENSPAAVNYRSCSRQIGDEYAQLLSADVRNDQGAPVAEVEITQPFSVRMEYRISSDTDRIYIPNFHFYCQDGSCAFIVNATNVQRVSSGEYSAECHVPANFLNDGVYSIGFALTSYKSGVSIHFHERGIITFNVRDPIDGVATRAGYSGPMPGAVRPVLPWTVKPIN